ncbi:hypothetical protein AB1286_33095 [Trinickia sp. NRRL B-1857]|uniref:hypothetical protein n=1 Tax=Trinickia sp. NRRL B-1857 TaxID=3162879 RepID=UPI003D2DC6FC
MATAANLFPSADPGAPDLDDDQPSQQKSAGGFPSAPPASAFGKVSVVNELREVGAELGATGTKVDRAIAFLRQNGPSDAARVAEMLGIRRDHVSTYLKTALKDGRIVRDGTMLKAGESRQPAPAEPSTEKPIEQPKRVPRPPKIAGNDATVSASLCVGALQIIQWAAGNLTIRANDNVVDLSDAQVLALHAFLELAR